MDHLLELATAIVNNINSYKTCDVAVEHLARVHDANAAIKCIESAKKSVMEKLVRDFDAGAVLVHDVHNIHDVDIMSPRSSKQLHELLGDYTSTYPIKIGVASDKCIAIGTISTKCAGDNVRICKNTHSCIGIDQTTCID